MADIDCQTVLYLEADSRVSDDGQIESPQPGAFGVSDN